MNTLFRLPVPQASAAGTQDRPHLPRARRLLGGVLLAMATSLPLSAVAHHNGEAHDDEEDTHQHHHADAAAPSTGVVVTGGYTFAPRPGVPNVGVYFDQVSNGGKEADELLSAQALVGKRTELHEMKMDGQVMRMREVKAIEVPASGTVNMQRGASYHVMVLGLDKPLKAGDRFGVKLRFRHAGEQTVQVEVRDASKAGSNHHHHHHDKDAHAH